MKVKTDSKSGMVSIKDLELGQTFQRQSYPRNDHVYMKCRTYRGSQLDSAVRGTIIVNLVTARIRCTTTNEMVIPVNYVAVRED